jgi:molecular chaperone GrpE (heat shock protein)
MSSKYKGHTQKLKAWTPTRRELIEELGTASDRELGLKYSLSAGRVKGLRRENGIASYTENKKRTPMSDLQEKVQSLEDEVLRLRAYVENERERSRSEAGRIVAASSRWIDMAPKLLAMKEDFETLILTEVNKKTSTLSDTVAREVAREVYRVRLEYEETNRAKGQKLFELPGYMYQEFKWESK